MPRRTVPKNLNKYMDEYRKMAACARKIAAMYIDTLELESHPKRVLHVNYVMPQTAYETYLAAGGTFEQNRDPESFAEVYVNELACLCRPYINKIAMAV